LHLFYIHITDPHTPTTGQQYTGIKGQGSHLTRHSGKALRLPLSSSPKPLTSLSHAVISLSFPRHAHARLLPPQLPSNSGSMGHSPQYLHPHLKSLILPPSRRQPGPRRHQRENGALSPFCWEYCSHFRNVARGGIDITWCVVRLFSRLLPVAFSFRIMALFFPGNWKLGMGCMCGDRHRAGGMRSSGRLA
jgi:hypothetical protein